MNNRVQGINGFNCNMSGKIKEATSIDWQIDKHYLLSVGIHYEHVPQYTDCTRVYTSLYNYLQTYINIMHVNISYLSTLWIERIIRWTQTTHNSKWWHDYTSSTLSTSIHIILSLWELWYFFYCTPFLFQGADTKNICKRMHKRIFFQTYLHK